jgi:pimeloyl-ACP methyl ester carboxylesterase
MPRPVYRQRWAWVDGMRAPPQETIPDVESAKFALSSLADFQDATGLADFAWRLFWNRAAVNETDGDLRSLLRRAHGFVVFMHGWSASGGIWEQLPALTCAANSRLIALTPDLNGFGNSPFLAEVPTVEHCDPSAVMKAVSHWVEMLGLRSSSRARRRRKVITFIGHSLGGAALFYFPERDWFENEYARCAVAPALLIDDQLRQAFYQALAVDSWVDKPVDELKAWLKPGVIENFLGSADETVRAEHLRVFETTSRGTLAQTFYAIGAAAEGPALRVWSNFHVILAHGDHMIDVAQMLRLLDALGLAPHQIQVVSGGHFLFSPSGENRRVHLRNREIMLGEILYLHEVCRERQRS